jgi:YVTN family beta-propeller protein
MAVDAPAHLLVVGTTSGNLVLLDSCSGMVVAQIDAGGVPIEVAVDSGAGTALVVLPVQHQVRIFAITSRRWLGQVALPATAFPQQVAVVSQIHQALILDPISTSLWVADTRSGVVQHTVSGLPGIQVALGVDAGRRRAYVGTALPNTLNVIDTGSWRVLRTIPVGAFPVAVAVSGQTGHVFVANKASRFLGVFAGGSGQLLRTIPLPVAPQALALDDQRGRLYVSSQGAGPLLALSIATGQVQRLAAHGSVLAVDPQTGTLFYLDAATYGLSVLTAPRGS